MIFYLAGDFHEPHIKNKTSAPTNLMPQHAFQPVLSGSGDVDGQCGPAVHHCHGGSGQEVVRHLDYNLLTHIQLNVMLCFCSSLFQDFFL